MATCTVLKTVEQENYHMAGALHIVITANFCCNLILRPALLLIKKAIFFFRFLKFCELKKKNRENVMSRIGFLFENHSSERLNYGIPCRVPSFEGSVRPEAGCTILLFALIDSCKSRPQALVRHQKHITVNFRLADTSLLRTPR